jgi:hypothetical protein
MAILCRPSGEIVLARALGMLGHSQIDVLVRPFICDVMYLTTFTEALP